MRGYRRKPRRPYAMPGSWVRVKRKGRPAVYLCSAHQGNAPDDAKVRVVSEAVAASAGTCHWCNAPEG